MTEPTHMAREIAEIAEAVARLSQPEPQAALRREAARLRENPPRSLLTLARGSSDHAATYLAYAAEYLTGVPVASVRPSLWSVYGRGLRAPEALCLAVSQSGRSADLVETAAALRREGTRVLALTNVDGSPLEAASDARIATCAGPEKAVPATKSVITSIVAGLWLAAHWSGEEALLSGLDALPEEMARRAPAPLPEVGRVLAEADRAVVIGRGAALGLAAEVALKLQETCGIFAVAYSAAEFLHGPSAIVRAGTPVIMLADGAASGLDAARKRLAELEADVVPVVSGAPNVHPLIDPLLAMPSLYLSIEAAARGRGISPDSPFHLQKETVTR